MSTLVDSVKNKVLGKIFNGAFAPGSSMREARLARDFGVSQATVREALLSLERDGLVTREPNIGTTVTRLTTKDIRERVQLRRTLEVQAALEAAKHMGPHEFAELEWLLARMGSFIEQDLYYEEAQADLDFHRYIWACSGNQTLSSVLERLTVPLLAFVSVMRASGMQRLSDVIPSHQPMIDALRSGDPEKIDSAFREGAQSTYLDFISEAGRN